jgi:ubiquinone/menaquinone biosynthesis C-methylase UbiE
MDKILTVPLGSDTDTNDVQKQKEIIKGTFDSVPGYDAPPLRFFKNSAQFFVSLLHLNGNERVLDVATGTGHAAIALAGRLPQGQVTAVDFSKGMLDIARKKAASMNFKNIEFIDMDMQTLKFNQAQFDAAICAFGIFFVPDMDAQLAHIASQVKLGGQVAICNFQENYFSPLRDLAGKRMIGYGAQPPTPFWQRIATKEKCVDFFTGAGIKQVRVESANMGYFLKDEHEWWCILCNTGMRRMLDQLTQEDQEKFQNEHLREVAALKTADGIRLDIGVLYTIGIK